MIHRPGKTAPAVTFAEVASALETKRGLTALAVMAVLMAPGAVNASVASGAQPVALPRAGSIAEPIDRQMAGPAPGDIIAPGHGGELVFEDDGTERVSLALDTRYTVKVSALVSRVTVSQTFKNHSNRVINGHYRFALAPNAAVSGMRLTIGERLIEGDIQEKAHAERVFQQAKRDGKRASLVSHSESNLFSTRIANFMPGETLTVSIDYQEVLRPQAGRVELRIPTAQTPRYGASAVLLSAQDGVSDESPISGELGAAGGNHLTAAGFWPATRTEAQADTPTPSLSLSASIFGFAVAAVESPTHGLCEQSYREGGWQLSLCPDTEADRDLVLSWVINEGNEPVADFLVQPGYSYPGAVAITNTQYETAQDRAAQDEYARVDVVQGDYSHGLLAFMPPQPDLANRLARELVLVIDTSGSMAGDSMVQARSALIHALGGLGPEDSFNIIAFSNEARPLWPDAKPATAFNLGAAQQFVRSLEADGGTEMASALELALKMPTRGSADTKRLRQVLFITDGAVNGEDALFGLIERRLGQSRLFPVAIGAAPNGYFMSRAAAAGRGSFTFIGHGGEVAENMNQLLSRIEHPVVSDLSVTWADGRPVDAVPAVLPDLYAGEALNLSLRAVPDTLMPIVVKGNTDGQTWERKLTPRPVPNGSGLDLQYGKARVDDLARQTLTPTQRRAATVALGLEYHLVTAHTSLIAVDKTRVSHGQGLDARLPEATPNGWQGGRLPQTASGSLGLMLAGGMLVLIAIGAAAWRREDEAV
ncbi:marine proteobacterial sortase target protein [Shewanella zhangzhouensis]|uniref:marine proteobacterial sortase target protein n=1 Tax=Shewanella zhangzhouensis TaxID=2864213 RepID=UPI001C65CED5|nr:marine proteobacterial sortase target protein [Shewanella zhangzhouensis]QYK03684.1 marine proteobacterial sortase target protein [Shewanella zhangzhouensis]